LLECTITTRGGFTWQRQIDVKKCGHKKKLLRVLTIAGEGFYKYTGMQFLLAKSFKR